MEESTIDYIPMTIVHNIIPIEIELGKSLNINANVIYHQREQLVEVLQRHMQAFT